VNGSFGLFSYLIKSATGAQWMSTHNKTFLFASLAVTLSFFTWLVDGALQKHDGSIQGKLSEQFAEDAKFANVHIAVRGGVVSLKGSVALLEDKRQAVKRASIVEHVRVVKNDIVVKTSWVPDGILRVQLKHDLRNHELDGLGLKIRKGVVTIRGTVKSSREQVLSLIAATEGVRDIRDRMTLVE
jgi:hypothetical protein